MLENFCKIFNEEIKATTASNFSTLTQLSICLNDQNVLLTMLAIHPPSPLSDNFLLFFNPSLKQADRKIKCIISTTLHCTTPNFVVLTKKVLSDK